MPSDTTKKSSNDITSHALKAVIVSVAGYAMDSFDLLMLAFMLPMISSGLGLSPVQGSSLVTATLCGSVIGGILFGILSDRFGRVRVLTWTILLFAAFTGLCSLAQGYWDLLAYRVVAGLGLGGEFGIGMTLVAETWPARYRARAASYVGLGWQLGAIIAALTVPVLVPLIGWRGMFAVGMIPCLLSFFIRRSTNEPMLFVSAQSADSWVSSLSLLVKDWRTVKITFALLVMCAVQNFGYYGLMIWLPNHLSADFGYSLTKSASWTVVTILGMCTGIFVFGQLADRIGRRPAFCLFQAGAAIMVVVYAHLASPMELLVGGAVMGLFVNGMVGGYGALMAELYPTRARATAQNVLFNLGRGVGGFGPLVIGALNTGYSFALAMALLSAIYLVDLIVTVTLVPETKGIALE